MEERDEYKFLKLRDAVSCLNQRLNLVGVVLELGLPRKSKGTDPNDFQSLREIMEGQHLNLICKILHICEVAEKEWVIYVWDGTDAPSTKIQTKMTDEMDNPLPLQLEKEPLPRDVLCTFPYVGSVLMVVLGEGNKNLGLGFLKTGMWLNFLSIICEVHARLWRGVSMPFTKLRYVPKEYRYVLGCQRSTQKMAI